MIMCIHRIKGHSR